MEHEDLPVISLPTEGVKAETAPASREPKAAAPGSEPRRATEIPRPPTTEIRRTGSLGAPRPPALAPRPAPPAPTADPRKASDMRKPGPELAKPAPPPAPPAPAEAAEPEEDPEKLLREYADRQKVKVQRLEQQLLEFKRVLAERDALRGKSESLARELAEARRQLEAAAKLDAVIKDLQGKIDAAILSNGILTEDKEKLKKGLAEQTSNFRKSEDRAVLAEKSLAEAQKSLAAQAEGRKEAEARISSALQVLQHAKATAAPTASITVKK
jgi:hypothetical protein